MKRHVAILCLLALLAGAGAQTAYAQLTATITGTITDATGAVVPGAEIVVINEDTGIRWEAKSNQAGVYTVPLLQPGRYRVTVQNTGFKPLNRSGIRLDVAQTARLDLTIEVGSSAESVNVVDEAPLLDTSSNAIGGSVTADKVENLPLKGRNSSAFMMLVPGVRATRATISQPVLESHYQFFSVNGSRPGQNQFMLDGGNNTNVGFNSPEYSVQVDSVQEFKVQTSNFSAEYANAAGAVINLVTKGGTNDLHGSVFEYFRNDALAATDFFSNSAGRKKPMFRFNQFGGTLGGPIKKNRTFFFGGYEGLRLRDPVVTTTSVPTDLQRAGDFSRTFTAAGALIGVYDPTTTRTDPANPGKYLRTVFPGNLVPAGRISPIAREIMKYYPAATSAGDPGTGLNNYFFSGPRLRPVNDFNGRVDHQLTDRTLLMGRYSWSGTTITQPATFGESNIASPGYSRNPQTHTAILLKGMQTFSPSLFGEFVSSFARFYFDRRGLSNGFDPSKLGFPSYVTANSPNLGFPSIGIDSMAGLGGYNNEHDAYDRYEFKANMSKLSGRHTFKFGGLFSVVKFNSRQNSTQTGTYSFGKTFTQGPDPLLNAPTSGFGYATFLLGTLTGGSHNANDVHVSLAQKYIGVYFQDDFKVTPKLSLNLGLRWDKETPRTERYNQLANFNYDATSTVGGVAVRGGLMYPGTGGLPRGHWNAQNKNFAPRFGFAYNLTKDTVVRGGFGMFYSNSWGSGRNGNGMPITGFTCSTAVTSSLDGGVTPFAVVSDPFPRGFCKASGSSAGLLTGLGLNIDMIDRNQKIPYAESWNLDIQRRLPKDLLFEIAYSGSRGINLAGTLEWNQLDARYMALGTQLNQQIANPFFGIILEGPLAERTITRGQSLRPYPQFQGVSSRDATYGASVYHAMYVKVERRFASGFSVLTSYTWSKLIDDVIPSRTGFPGESFSGAPLQNYYDRKNERSLASFDTPHTLVISSVYELPFGVGKRFLKDAGPLNRVLGGWQINGVTLFQSGPPLQVNGGNANGAFAGTQRPNWSGKNATKSGAITDRLGAYFDTTVFSFNDPFTYGNAPRMMPNLRGPGAANIDLSVFKNTRLTERVRLQFRAEAFNAFNRVQFQIPTTGITSAAFGRISAQANSPRDIQLALKLLF